jgi:hypothetical protein
MQSIGSWAWVGFLDRVTIRCPNCLASAVITLVSQTDAPSEHLRSDLVSAPRQLTCVRCGLVKRWTVRRDVPIDLRGRRDPWFGLDPALLGDFRREVIWAYNLRHLDVIEQFVAAELRPRRTNKPQSSDRGETEAGLERLPAWMTSAKSRDDVLQCIAKMRRRSAT